MNNPFSKRPQPMNDEQYLHQQTDAELVNNAAYSHPGDEQIYMEDRKEREDLTRWQQDLEPEMLQMVHDLNREFYNSKTERWERLKETIYINGRPIIQNAEPICNDLCIQMMVVLLRPNMTRNLMMSNYSEERILQKQLKATLNFITNIRINYSYYELSKRHFSNLVQMFIDAISPTHFRAVNNGERRYISTVNKEQTIRTHTDNPDKKQKGLFNM